LRILLTGRKGQIGSQLEGTLPALGEVIATDHSTLDLADAGAIRRVVREARADVILNAAAYTAVDRAEIEPQIALQVNGVAPGVLADEAKRSSALLIHYSTDYVFDGVKGSPYVEADPPNPLNAYGRSKLEGERRIAASGCRHLILRTSWVYGSSGQNFLLTMLRLAREGRPIRVVNDQHGAPTSNLMIAAATANAIRAVLVDPKLEGLYHMTAQGRTTWCGFACEIFKALGIAAEVTPIRTDEYPTPARRPANSVLDNARLNQRFGIRMPSWQAGLAEVIDRLR
jgi:dTDP-4-dehydrorhamnose reductase